MNLWYLLNSQFFGMFFTVLVGGFLVKWISFKLQKKIQEHSVKMIFVKELINVYQTYIRFLRRSSSITKHKKFDKLHTEMLSKSYMATIIFNPEFGKDIRTLADKLCTCQQLRDIGKVDEAEKQRVEVIKSGQHIIEELYKVI